MEIIRLVQEDGMDEIGRQKQVLAVASVLLERSKLAATLGSQFDGKRDIYEAVGYPKTIGYERFMGKYLREDICGRIVDLPAEATWRHAPVIRDGDEDSGLSEVSSPFVRGVRWLVEKRRLWHYCTRLDRLCGIGRFAVLLIGIKGGKALSAELTAGECTDIGDVIYFSVFDEGAVKIEEIDCDPKSARFGLPVMYAIQMGEGLGTERVHWSHLIHVAEDLLTDEVYGRPRLERVFNRTEDLLKVVAGGSEAIWKNMDRGLQADIRDGFSSDTGSLDDLEKEIDEYMHGLRRFIRTQGVDVNPLGSDVVDPTGMFSALIDLIAAATEIPKRILMGSERGELASSQDAATWAGQIASRREEFAEPVMLKPLIDRLLWLGALPMPTAGRYDVVWTPLFEATEKEIAEVALLYAQAAAEISPGAPELAIPLAYYQTAILRLPKTEVAVEEGILDEEDADGSPD